MLTYDPKYDRTDEELEAFLIFAICVAGKNADQTIEKVKKMLRSHSPFAFLRAVRKTSSIDELIKAFRMGQYDRIGSAINGVIDANLDLRTCTPDQLEAIRGIGPKTARFFIMFTRPNQRMACLDTHILAWLRDRGIKAPKTTPSGKSYARLEETFLSICDEKGMDPTTMDYAIWQEQRSK